LEPGSLLAIRELAGYTQTQLARITGLSQGHISDLERGDKQARPVTIRKLAIALNVPMPALLAACMHGADDVCRGRHTTVDVREQQDLSRPGRPEMVA
jgi:transcriptional regulator with XRE-family HTH domain